MSEKFLYQTLKEMPLKLSEDEFLEYAKERRIPDYITSNIKHTLFEWQEYAIRSLIEYEYFKERNNPNIPTHLMFNMATGVACKNTNRKFIGIELDEEYFNIASKRILDK